MLYHDGRSLVSRPGADRAGAGRRGGFRYLFPAAADLAATSMSVERLDALAAAMDAPEATPRDSRTISAVVHHLCQFVDHDVAAAAGGATWEAAASDDPAPAPRALVERDLVNLRDGRLRLDSLYGDRAEGCPLARRLAGAMRMQGDPAKMRLASPCAVAGRPAPRPEDGAADLLRLGALLDDPDADLTVEALRGLRGDLRDVFVGEDGAPRVQRAVIGDMRNDEDLAAAQLHLAFLRLHNNLVACCADRSVLARGREAVFEWARAELRRIYQWLLINVLLPSVCEAQALGEALYAGAPLFSAMLARRPVSPGGLPLPMEFCFAAFRFRETMQRPSYDWNRYFGRAVAGSAQELPCAPVALLRRFTGFGRPTPMPRRDGGSYPRLPSDWVVEWDRLAAVPDRRMPDRAARSIDTRLFGAAGAAPSGGRARRSLRLGYGLNVPSGQSCLRGVNAAMRRQIEPLCAADLTSGRTGAAVADGLLEHTPLWFYVLKEAEVCADGETLGPLGSALVADTIVGLVVNDPRSYWREPGSDNGRWRPHDGVQPAGEPIDSMPALLRAAGVL